jgi:adenine-specific DNA-methyltransferase
MDKAIEYLNALPPSPGYVTKTFCEDARFFQSGNGGKIDAIREEIAGWYTTGGISENEMSMLLVSLMEAADRVDSTVGLQMAYLKDWAKRSFNPLELRPLEIPEGPVGWASRCNALEFVSAAASDYIFDLVYIDPPYNQHSYLSNYHIWESLCLWDKPETYGVAQKRIDCRTRKSPYNSKKTALAELERVVSALRCRYALLSFNNEGFISLDTMEAVLSRYGNLSTYEVDHDRYVGAKIGVHNLKGEKVGTVGKLKNKEYLYLLGK